MAIAYIALGSNLNQPVQQLDSALNAMANLPQTQILAVSSFYCSKPLGPQDQPDYINAVAKIETTLEPIALLDALQQIELEQGRVRLRHWGERTLDLDILLYDQLVIKSERLTIPHYDMHNREFVIVPLYEIAPELTLSSGEKISELINNFKNIQMELVIKTK
ncbi:2-amino-4-hydroxy-6-hydroxymethyldihydropteridine diphosphokinase [Lonepinella koalarum]|uniref:2-amino-4-hydroxy-6-hydroxymethyldihydropteridine pyrophosphokinase n=1 Tax=Lonepinella koalarum TaxID=53417 RepID=A0A4R1L2G9_9PAST|nr:2-amino-4-hydroxy-6-hydroxymethyldihydropteridine diphosphokinase [Lonepinella koalarum]MDH2926995.1 7,8-dihydro-6-hydroxymethylpterin-pyrophosphokinase [Lonepinella koalarum]TCK70349.1 2-amino-4-hydroxy-6-hydroxymethyldihydropteridine diphosphokinase [Lonepinella koalarum]TFJ89265.1 2-amino-4-hydroxy-6-hydroxymethyldihydropteridine diphosphokinase [Lonepinella koalarum]TYG33443.1 2-amino-4-hydroxy-6-hydroxymethyldihydropteridine diphosphokinase [Lonepinella koalarum]